MYALIKLAVYDDIQLIYLNFQCLRGFTLISERAIHERETSRRLRGTYRARADLFGKGRTGSPHRRGAMRRIPAAEIADAVAVRGHLEGMATRLIVEHCVSRQLANALREPL